MTDYKFNQLVNLEQLQQLLESHHRLSGMACGLFDANENNLLAVGWQQICTQFHRINPVSCARCRESDAFVKAHLHNHNAPPREYRCKNNMIEIAIPIVIDGHHLATVSTGQFFYDDEPPDRDLFIAQGNALNFSQAEYLQALDAVPLLSREYVRNHVLFLFNIVKMLAETGLNNLKLAAAVTRREQAEEAVFVLNRKLKALSRCNQILVRAENEQALLDEICQVICSEAGYRMAWVGFAEHDADKTVRSVAQSGFEDGYLDGLNITWADSELGQGPTGVSIRTARTVINQDYLANPQMRPWREAAIKRNYQASIALPLICNKQVLGSLAIYSAEPFAFADEELALLEELANDLAYGIQTLRMRAEHDEVQQRLEFLAHHDSLTALPNRLLLRDRFEQAVALAKREHLEVALLVLDLDNFKQINDSLGHGSGDQLLISVVARLKGCLRDTDTISRQGGDEFAILLSNAGTPGIIETIAQNIIEAFAAPFNLSGHALNISFSIGISVFPNDGAEFDTLFRQADTALLQAKEAGRNTYRFFSREMNTDALEHMQMQGQLRNALQNNEFLLHYQPQIHTESGRIIGAEALVRWRHPELGLVPPGKFIPLAERSGLIIPLGEWVLNEACRQAQIWQKKYQLPPILIAVNLSALQFKRGNIVETVRSALARSGLPAAQLELELTESILLSDVDEVMKTLRCLKEIGVQLSIDDFGTGYSSLAYLKRLTVDKLKIDQSFVRDMESNAEDAAIVQAINQLGHTLKLTTIAEGVETKEQLALLKKLGCDEIQGYLFSRPIPGEEFAAFCSRHEALAVGE
jgi:diguanylate cyclase (GGDEF)-like protein